MADLKKFSSSASANNSPSPDGFPEGMAPSGVNDSARELMAAVKRFYNDIEYRDFDDTPTQATATSFTVSGDRSTRYHADRRVRVVEESGNVRYGTVTSVSFSSNTRVTLAVDSGNLSASLSAVAVGIAATNNSLPRNTFLQVSNNLSELTASAADVRSNLGVSDDAILFAIALG